MVDSARRSAVGLLDDHGVGYAPEARRKKVIVSNAVRRLTAEFVMKPGGANDDSGNLKDVTASRNTQASREWHCASQLDM
jgi:hypothetical protein